MKTPFLLDDGAVSDGYGILGKGMRPGLPGHRFVLIDKEGQQRFTDPLRLTAGPDLLHVDDTRRV